MDPVVDRLRENYDTTPYPGMSFPASHPDRLKTVAALEGFSAPPVTACRVLEIGCAIGTNLIPMAQALAGSTFLGIDLSPRQIQTANELVTQLGLRNIEFRCQDLMDFSADQGQFDYIIAHGVYSWVPTEVRQRLMQLIQRHLSPQGLAYLCFNTLPGWHTRRIARDLLLLHLRGIDDPTQKLAKAREIAAWAQAAPSTTAEYKAMLTAAFKQLLDVPEWLFLHDAAEACNEPVYLEQFVQHARAHDLQYVCPASTSMSAWHWQSPELQQQLTSFSPDPIVREQYLDFQNGRSYRDAVLCRGDAVRSSVRDTQAIEKMYVAGRLTETPAPTPQDPKAVLFAGTHNKNNITLRGARVITVFRRIKDAWPHAVPVAELLDLVENRSLLLERFLIGHRLEMLELWTRPTDFFATDFHRPCTTALVRNQARVDGPINNLRHENLILSDVQALLPLLDGSRDLSEICRLVGQDVQSGKLVLTILDPNQSKEDLSGPILNILNGFHADSLLIKPSVVAGI